LICPACTEDTASVLGRRDGLDVFRCESAGCRYHWRTPLLAHRQVSYQDRSYHWDRPKALGLPNFEERYPQDFKVGLLRLEKIAKFVKPVYSSRLLDYGCASGAFVAAALHNGYCAYGVDACPAIIKWAIENNPQLEDRIFCREKPLFNGFNVITAHDILEHLIDPTEKLVQLRRYLVPGGLLVIEAPDPESEIALAAGINAYHLKPREHTMLPSVKTWTDMLDFSGYDVAESNKPVPQKLAIYALKRGGSRKN